MLPGGVDDTSDTHGGQRRFGMAYCDVPNTSVVRWHTCYRPVQRRRPNNMLPPISGFLVGYAHFGLAAALGVATLRFLATLKMGASFAVATSLTAAASAGDDTDEREKRRRTRVG